MNTNDKLLKAVELTNLNEKMQDKVNVATNVDLAYCLQQEDKIAEIQVLYKEESLLDKCEVAAIKEIREGEVSSNLLNTGLDDSAIDNKGVSHSAEEHTFNMDDLISLLDELWPTAEKRIESINQVSESLAKDIKKQRKNMARKST